MSSRASGTTQRLACIAKYPQLDVPALPPSRFLADAAFDPTSAKYPMPSSAPLASPPSFSCWSPLARRLPPDVSPSRT
eukprot:scaffold7375_cov268-Pinguiococcus_pyrenoidosus.AAC.51